MEVNLLEVREDGYQAYCVIFSPGEIDGLNQLRYMESMENTIKNALEVGIEE